MVDLASGFDISAVIIEFFINTIDQEEKSNFSEEEEEAAVLPAYLASQLVYFPESVANPRQ